MEQNLVKFVREIYQTQDFIPLHAPTFSGNEKAYVCSTIESTFVSSVGAFVDRFEQHVQNFTGATRAIATVNGTAALHTALYMAGVQNGDLVITQALTFVATCNALYHMGAEPVFIDVSPVSMGLCPKAMATWLENEAELIDEQCQHKATKKPIRAVIPMHTFGHPVELDELLAVCIQWHLVMIEDAAESLGSLYKGKHSGTIAPFGAISFNGNKIITTGGGGMVLCQNIGIAERTKHITTTAKVPHAYEFFHDEAGFNYRLPNLNAALGCAQMELLPMFLAQKRALASAYQTFFKQSDYQFFSEPSYAQSNYWLNAIICPDTRSRERLLVHTNNAGVMTRPIWKLMHRLPMFANTLKGSLTQSEWFEARVVNIPSSPVILK
jgi:UDP-N-acetylbacillosamine transaminase